MTATIDPSDRSQAAKPDGQSSEAPPPLTDLQTRFLYPFYFESSGLDAAVAALLQSLPLGREKVWGRTDASKVYVEEALDHAADFLFSEKHPAGCRYLKVSDSATRSWFHDASIRLGDGRAQPIELIPQTQVELFLSQFGVGVLSIGLTPFVSSQKEITSIDPRVAVDFNYRLAQLQPWSAAKIHLAHPREDKAALARLPDSDLARLEPIPAGGAPLGDRVGKRGGDFTLPELIGELLKGLRHKPLQPVVSVYTVARLGSDTDFASPASRHATASLLSALAQVEEPGHAGSLPGRVSVANALLNRRHRAAVGQLGAAHLVADQPGDNPYNEQRLPRVRDKYFIQYLMALLQRLVVHRTIDRASAILAKSASEGEAELAGLRGELLCFAIGGHITQVSSRHALHRFYKLARAGLGVRDGWSAVRSSLADLDARLSQERQEKLAGDVALQLETVTALTRDTADMARKMDENLGIIAGVQRLVHYIEMAIVSVYFAHLWHMFAENESFKHWVERWCATNLHVDVEGDWVVSIGVAVSAMFGLVFASILAKFLHGKGHHESS